MSGRGRPKEWLALAAKVRFPRWIHGCKLRVRFVRNAAATGGGVHGDFMTIPEFLELSNFGVAATGRKATIPGIPFSCAVSFPATRPSG